MVSQQENLLALAWSVNTSTWPFTPILAVGGTGRIIYIFNVDLVYEESGEVKTVTLRLDRTIVGPGKVRSRLSHLVHCLANTSHRSHRPSSTSSSPSRTLTCSSRPRTTGRSDCSTRLYLALPLLPSALLVRIA